MKIAIIIERANITLGGAERSVFELATALSALGHKVEILAAKGQTKAANIKILCQKHHGKRIGILAFARELKKYINRNGFDIIHSVLPFDFADVYQPRGGSYPESIRQNAASYQNKFMEAYKRTFAFANLNRTIFCRMEKKLCKNPNGPVIAALSEYVAIQFRNHYNLENQRIVVIPNGIRTDKKVDANIADKLRTRILAQLGLKEAAQPVFFLFVANNFRLKGLGPLIKAMKLAADGNLAREPYLLVVGSGRAGKYRRLAKKFGIQKQIVFLGSVRHIQNLLSIIDAGVLPTFYDPASRFILEALAARKPVITTEFNGIAELITDNRYGKIIDTPTNIGALAEAICYFSGTENIRQASAAIDSDNLKDFISIARAAKQTELLYESILEKRRLR